MEQASSISGEDVIDHDVKREADVVDSKSWTDELLKSLVSPHKDDAPTATMPVARDAEKYNMNHKRRGKAVIFNHKTFTNGQSTRNGTEKDEYNLKLCLMSLGFEVIVYRDLTKIKLLTAIEELEKEDHSDCDCILICVLSHGEQDKIYCSDGDYRPEDLWNPFAANRCPSLAGKPKIFFIQACRGDQLDSGISLTSAAKARTFTDGPSKDETMYVVPNRADFLIVYSTAEGYYSWRNTTDGSWFVQSLTKVLEAYKDKKDLLSMMTIVARLVALDFESNTPGNPKFDQKKQIPMISSTLIREVYL